VRRWALAGLLAALAVPRAAQADTVVTAGSVYARATPTEVVLGNALAERRWSRASLVTTALVDKRDGGRTWSAGHRDFALDLAGRAELGSDRFGVTAVKVARLERGGLKVSMELASPLPGLTATRTAEAYPGVAGFRTQTILHPATGLALSGATLDEAAVAGAAPTLHAFRAGSDWREPGWAGPPVAVGDAHPGDWRETTSASAGQALSGPGEWLDLDRGGRRLFLVMERNDLPSSQAGYDGTSAALRIDYARDVLSLGPVEEDAHVENPGPAGRVRVLVPGRDLALNAAFTGFGSDADDAAWQFHRYLAHRVAPWPHDVIFNSDGTDADRISTGAKDDMDLATIQQVAPLARRLGVDTFVLDDGWQAASGDWEPDSPQYPEPRGKFPPRFPDATFAAVRRAIAPMKLGLWMSPLSFNPAAAGFKAHPDWACAPVGDATAALNALQPDDSSNEAGIGFWGANALAHVQSRIEDAIDHWGVRSFKFDFLAWFDCAGQNDLWGLHDRFVDMLDTLRAKHPGVVFQIDETNDYRLFPFESIARGPTWFQNGAPGPERLLHNIWELSPWIPAYALGQKALAGDALTKWPLDTAMAAALPSEIIFASDLRTLPPGAIDAAAPWVGWAKAHRRELSGVTFPLLDDPIKLGWTALQTWDPAQGRGVLLAFRQDSADATRTIALRDVPPGRRFVLRSAPGDAVVGEATSAQLRAGVPITIDRTRGARVLLIEPAR
jgi:melibiase-like protein